MCYTFNDLYYKFKKRKNDNPSFVIPLLFERKYCLFNQLENQNNLSFDNFIDQYKPEKINTQYDQLFQEKSVYELEENISEIFSNAKLSDLFIATNQNIKNNETYKIGYSLENTDNTSNETETNNTQNNTETNNTETNNTQNNTKTTNYKKTNKFTIIENELSNNTQIDDENEIKLSNTLE